ncbi:hypothetical protein [Halobellus inordinatus]|uniref:hypothetical protein n=1 Tax=Halobellus inordinatus TaxID=1126236 RepID=UPI00210EA302|nr:hypothetical protein [Halobellus inordinatus]
MTDDDVLAHLAGYGAIVAVLASASWSGVAGMALGGLFVIAVVIVLGLELFRYLTRRLRREAESAAAGVSASD